MAKEENKSTSTSSQQQQQPNQTEQQKKPKKGKKDDKEEELSEEDKQLKTELELIVTRVQDKDEGVQKLALNTMANHIKTSTSTMTSVPKPLKFLRPFYDVLKTSYLNCPASNKVLYADVMSMLATTMAAPGSHETLKFKLESLEAKDIGSWGHEYVRHLTQEIAEEYQILTNPTPTPTTTTTTATAATTEMDTSSTPTNENKIVTTSVATVDQLLQLVDIIVPFDVKHNVEAEACDLLMEVDKLDNIIQYCDERNYSRVCLYLISCANYVPEPEDSHILNVAYQINKKLKKYPEALRIALRMNSRALIDDIFNIAKSEDELAAKQMAFMLARQRVFITVDDPVLDEIIGNGKLNQYFAHLAKDLDSLEPKAPEDIYKSHLTENRTALAANIDSARKNLASSFVNGFVNAGYGSDTLMLKDGINWVYKNKEHGMMSSVASLGMLLLWDVDSGLGQIDKYLYAPDNYIKAGGLLATGILASGLRSDADPAKALLSEHLNGSPRDMRLGAIIGYGIAYAGTAREDLFEELIPIIIDPANDAEIISFACLALGLIYVGSCNDDIALAIVQVLMDRDEAFLNNTLSRFIALGLGLLFLGKQEAADATIELTKALHPKIAKYCELTVESCAYAGTGNVLKIQKLLQTCGEHPEEEKTETKEGAAAATGTAPASAAATSTSGSAANPNNNNNQQQEDKNATKNKHQGVAVLGIAMISMSEDIGSEMSMRCFDHLLQYGDLAIKRAVPLALGMLNISTAKLTVMDTLSKLSHDADVEVSQSAILALGLLGAGTNNARIAQMLRQLAAYYSKEPNHLFVVRIAQGFVFLGKGLLTLSPYHSDRTLMSHVALSGIITVMHSCLDLKDLILGKYHYLLYHLACTAYPRMMITVDEDLNPISVSCRVGQAVDVVAQAGRPKTITGFQTHNTPVLLQHGERAELATEEYIPLTPILEGVVIVKKNPDFVEYQ